MFTQGLCGLRNIGNTCFMNSIIQCLSHTKDLSSYLRAKGDIRSLTAAKDSRIVTEFAKLIKEMWSGSSSSVTPSELKLAFSSKHRMYSGCSQQDAQEFLRFFLDALHCALNAGTKGEKLEIDENLSNNTKADRTWEWYSKVENSVIKDLFVGQLKSSLKCTVCGNSSVTFDPFWDLRLVVQGLHFTALFFPWNFTCIKIQYWLLDCIEIFAILLDHSVCHCRHRADVN